MTLLYVGWLSLSPPVHHFEISLPRLENYFQYIVNNVIFVNSKVENCTLRPLISSLSEQDAQLTEINIDVQHKIKKIKYITKFEQYVGTELPN